MALGRDQVTANALKGQPVQCAEFGCNGAHPQTPVTLPANATDLATSEALVNAIKTALIANGICQ
jgi:hypothetical protein